MIPFAALSIRFHWPDGTDLEVSAMDVSVEGFTFRLIPSHHPELAEQVTVRFRDYGKQSYQTLLFDSGAFEIEEEEKNTYFTVWNFRTDVVEFSREMMRFMGEYTEFAERKAYGTPEELLAWSRSKQLQFQTQNAGEGSGESPAGLLTPRQKEERILKLLSGVPVLALAVDSPWTLERFLTLDFSVFAEEELQKLFASEQTVRHLSGRIRSLFLGNAYCPELLPSHAELSQAVERCDSLGLSPILQLPPVNELDFERVTDLLNFYRNLICRPDTTTQILTRQAEVVINDPGMLLWLREQKAPGFRPILGNLFVKRRKDVRMEHRNGAAQQLRLLQETSVNAEFYYTWLVQEYDICDLLLESCGYPIRVPQGAKTLLLPWYQTNTSGFCALAACVETGQRGRQKPMHPCPQYCRDTVFAYADERMRGCYNSLFGLDDRILKDPDYLETYLEQGIERVVLCPMR